MKFKLMCSSDSDIKMNRYLNQLRKNGFDVKDLAKSKGGYYSIITISSIEELIKVKDVLNQDLVITNDIFIDKINVLEIYDYYRE